MFLGTLAGSVLLGAPITVPAQQPGKVYRIGSISEVMSSNPVGQGLFYDRMRELGWVYGRDYVVEHRVNGGQLERIPDLAAELMRWGVDVIHVTGHRVLRGAREAPRTTTGIGLGSRPRCSSRSSARVPTAATP
jgi:hypothetical protein